MNIRDRLAASILLATMVIAIPGPAASAPVLHSVIAAEQDNDHPSWLWPLDDPRTIVVPYRAPAHAYGAGHRGIDLLAEAAQAVRAPAGGIVAFRGTVVDRPLLTIEHPGGYVSTFEPLLSTLSPGDVVAAGDVVGAVSVGGHASPGTLHLGVRLDGAYINPMLLLGEVRRAVLLPCCAPL